MICLLQVIEGPLAGHQCWLRDDQRLSIGRMSTADFPVVSDLHMSRCHLLVEGNRAAFRLRDVGSSNGTWVNESRVSTVEICDGDTIRAGMSAFRVSLRQAGTTEESTASSGNLTPFSRPAGTDSDARQTMIGIPFIPIRSVHKLDE